MAYRAAVLTVSDLGFRGERDDTAGPAAAELLAGVGFEVVERAVLPDEPDRIATALIRLADEAGIDLVLTAGGTGLAPRDRTPEATLQVIESRVPGMEEAMRAASVAQVPTAMLSRAVAGVRGRTLIVNLPGSERAVRENLQVLLPVLGHACASLAGDAEESAETHKRLSE
ncbi:MAG: MogA/MoaB family molybdenum cofactor biosynthesis protein [Dehalococcoidia bacterium]